MALETIATLDRQKLAQVFTDPRSLAAFEAFIRQVSAAIPNAVNALGGLNYVVTALDSEAPNAHLVTAGTGIGISAAPGAVTFALTNTPVAPGSYALAILTVDAQGRITAAASAATTGTGAVVLTASPTITTPTIITPAIVGVTDGSNAAAGRVGEIKTVNVPAGSAVSVTSSTPTNITSLSLPAGDWDVWGSIGLKPSSVAISMTTLGGVLNTVSATLPAAPNGGGEVYIVGPAAGITAESIYPIGMMPLSLSVTTTVYLIGYATFTGATLTAYGVINARRVR